MSDEPQKSPVQLTRSLPPWWVFGGSLAVGLVILAAIFPSLWLDTATQLTTIAFPPTAPSPRVPKIDYQALISEETAKAKAQTDVIVKVHEALLAKLDQAHAPKFASAAYSASEEAAGVKSIAMLIYYLARDMAMGTNAAESHLNSLIDPSISPALSDFRNEVNAETARFDYELRKVTVQLATNIATIGPGNARPPPRIDSPEETSRNFQQILNDLGRNTTIQVLFPGPILYDLGKNVLPKLIKPIGAIAGRMFAKQAAKVAVSPEIAAATGAFPVVQVTLAVVSVAWIIYDIYQIRPHFQDEVYQKLKTNLDEIRTSAKAQALKSASIRSKEIRKLQLDIGVRALDDFTKQEAK